MRPKIKILADALIQQIISESLHILATVGIEVRGRTLRERLLAHGLPADPKTGRVLFPEQVVRQAIADTPPAFTLYDRDGNPYADLGGDRVHFVPGSSGLKVLDHRTGQTRLANTRDFVEYIRVADSLTHIAYPATAFSTNDDIPPEVSDAWRLFLVLTNTRKPVVSGAFTEHGVPRMAEMMGLFRRDQADLIAHPMAIFTITATGNFRYSEDSCQNLLDCVEWGIPIEVVPVTLMGLVAPVTLVGAAVFHTVDTLAGLTLAQVVRPGAPVLFGGAPAAFHMKAATSPMIALEALRLDIAYIEVAKALGLPTQGYMGLSEGKFLDAQAGGETFSSALLAALAGVNSVSGPGMLDYLLVFSLQKLVFDEEICGQVLQFVKETAPMDDLPTMELVRAQLQDEHMLTAPHTLAHWPEALYMPGPIIDRENRENWEKAGSQTLMQRATAEVERRLAAYQPLETDPRAVETMQRLISAGMHTPVPLPAVPAPVRRNPAPAASARRRKHRRQPRTDG